MFDKADLACEAHVAHWLQLATEPRRAKALERLLDVWHQIMADELGEPVADHFARLEILELALDDHQHHADVELGNRLN